MYGRKSTTDFRPRDFGLRPGGEAQKHFLSALLLFFAVFLGAYLFGAGQHAFAQGEASSAQARAAQFVFVIDDSGSMSRHVGGDPAADPDRLAVFAIRSVLSMLDDVDEATVVRLNGVLDGESIMPIAPLSENRPALEKSLEIDGTLAKYAGPNTPCTRSFAQVKDALNQAYRPNVAQVMIFLTDGACTGRQPVIDEFLSGIKSADDELFKFFLLRFEARDYTKDLATLAQKTGGSSYVTNASDPSAILQPFANALSHSQGYESYLLTPSSHTLDAHQGARRVRLLAVAPDKGNELEFSIDPARQGEKPELIGAAKGGLHQYEDGARYRYAALDYRPGTVPVTVKVQGAGDDWKVVAVPEYRLFVDSSISLGACSGEQAAGGEAQKSIAYAEVGSRVCVQARLVNEAGEAVTADAASRGTEAVVRYQAPGEDEPSELPAKRVGESAIFELERSNLVKGDHIIRPVVRLAAGQQAASVSIQGAAHNLEVSALTIHAEPSELDLGEFVPGSEAHADIAISGNFPSNQARLVVQNRDDLPECVRFRLSGVEEGAAQKITPGQSYKVGMEIAAYCGLSSFSRDLQATLNLEFEPTEDGIRPPTLVLPLKFKLINEFSVPEKLSASITAGESASLDLGISGNFEKNAQFSALLAPVDQRENWPSGRGHLEIEFLDGSGKLVRKDGKPAQSHRYQFAPGAKNKAMPLRVKSDACCSAGSYRAELVLAPAAGTKEPIRVPIEVEVAAGSVWQCWGPLIIKIIAALLILLLILYIYNMFRNSSFLSKKRLAMRLEMLEWDAMGMPVGLDGGPRKVKNIVEKSFSFSSRARAWFAANPLKLGLPNDYKYDETLRIMLNADQPQMTRMRVLERVEHYQSLEQRPIPAAHIFVSQRRGFYGVPDMNGYFGQFQYTPYIPSADDEPQCIELNGAELLLADSRQMQGTFAGWKIGY